MKNTPLPLNEFSYCAFKLTIDPQRFNSSKIYALVDFGKNVFQPEISVHFYAHSKFKKEWNLFFLWNILTGVIFGPKWKKVFFFDFIKIAKNVARRIFDESLCCFYIATFLSEKTILAAFLPLFSRVSIKYPHKRHFWFKRKKIFFLLNFIKIVKNVARRIFDKRFSCFYISAFFLQPPFFRLC